MRVVVSALALSATVSALVGCSGEAQPLEAAIPLLDSGKRDAGAKRDAAPLDEPDDAGDVADSGAPDATVSADAGPPADAAPAIDATAVGDAGRDAGSADSGSIGPGPIDAGPIGPGPIDAGPIDAGGLRDAGTSIDAGAAQPDAGVRDAAVDAGTLYAHTIAIDGQNDFTAAETFPTTTAGFTFYLAWDATYVYVGASGNDVETSAAATKWWQLYFGTSASGGTTSGVLYGTQRPTLPQPFQWHFRWKTSNDYTGALSWSGSAWTDPNLPFAGNVFRGSGTNFVEMRIARATLGNPTTLAVLSSFLNEAANGEATFAGAPSTTFADGTNPSYAKALVFDLAKSPAAALVQP